MAWMKAGSLDTNHMKGRKEDDRLIFESVEDQSDQYGTFKTITTFFNITEDAYEWKQDRIYDGKYLVENVTFYHAKRIR